METGPLTRIWEDRWRLGAWTLPVLVAVVFAHKAVLPMATELRDTKRQWESLRENIYEPAWLDSTRGALSRDVETLREFRTSREAALNREGSVQATVDRIRGLAQKSGIEVVKTTPILGKSDSLRVIKVRIEGFSFYAGLLAFFEDLKANHPDLYLEEMVVRLGGARSQGRLEGHLTVHAYDRRAEGGK